MIRRNIEITRKIPTMPIDIAVVTDLLPIEFRIVDVGIPEGATAEVIVVGKNAKHPCTVSGNIISFAPEKDMFDEGKNVVQFVIHADGKKAVSFFVTINGEKTLYDEEV